MSLKEHRARAPSRVRCAVVVVSDSRTARTDESGKLIARLLASSGHAAAGRVLVANDAARIGSELRRLLASGDVDAVILSGGTGISGRDRTVDAARAFFDRELPGFGELFRLLSHRKIGAAAMLSRAAGGIAAGKPVFCLPGSPDAVRLGLESLILPELGHIIGEVRKGNEPTGARRRKGSSR